MIIKKILNIVIIDKYYKIMKIGIIKETKIPEDNRVALIPKQIIELEQKYPNIHFCVQSSNIRCISDREYLAKGIEVKDDISDCDILFGIKEASLSSLIENKHYFFFGHIAKMQEYNKPLLKKMIEQHITFSDYEYLVDDKGRRVCAFGWWAGVVGVYNTLRAYGIRYDKYKLPITDINFTLEILLSRLTNINLGPIKILITGNGRVAKGARYVLEKMGIRELSVDDFLNKEYSEPTFCNAIIKDLVKKNKSNSNHFDREDFRNYPENYISNFQRFSKVANLLVACHYWGPKDPIYIDENLMKNKSFKIKIIGDVTCDIMGGIRSTIRPSTHTLPFYDYNPITEKEEPAFTKNEHNITVMAVDTLPNALAKDTSKYFGDMLSKHVFPLLLKNNYNTPLIVRSTILKNGVLTNKFSYLNEFANK